MGLPGRGPGGLRGRAQLDWALGAVGLGPARGPTHMATPLVPPM